MLFEKPIITKLPYFIICFCLQLVLSGCVVQEPESVKVGFIGCLSGKCSDLGTSGRDGFILAVDEINKKGGFIDADGKQTTIEVVSTSTHTIDGDFAAIDNFRNLVAQDVVAVIGPMTSQVGTVLKPEADATQTVLLAPTVSTTQLSGKNDYFFRVYPTCDLTAPALAQYATQVDGLKTFVIAYDEINVAYVDPWIEHFRREVVEQGGQIVGLQPLSDIRPMIISAERVHGLQPEGVLVIANAYQTGLFIQQLQKLGSSAHILGTEWSTAKGLLNYSGRALEGSYFTSSFDQASEAENSLNFQRAFLSRFNHAPSFAAKFSYEAVMLLGKALSKTAGGVDLKQALTSLGPVSGLQTDLEMDLNGDIERAVFIKRFREGSFQTVAEYVDHTIKPLHVR